MNIDKLIYEVLSESKTKKKKGDRCTRLAKQKYDVWPSAYASGAVVKCRQGKIWKEEVESIDDDENVDEEWSQKYKNSIDCNNPKGFSQKAHCQGKNKKIDESTKTDYSKENKSGLHGWFSRQGGKGKSQGWVDCNTCRTDSKGKKTCKSCGRTDGEDRAKYPACRPTPSACGTKGKGEKWGKKTPMKLTEKVNISTELKYHLENEISLSENVFRIYSENFFNIINEVRKLYNKNLITLNEEDSWLVESDLGKKVILEGGEEVYLDAPMYEEESEEETELRENLNLDKDHVVKIIKKMGSMRYFSITFDGIAKLFLMGNIYNILFKTFIRHFRVTGVPHFKRLLDLDFDYFVFMNKNEPYYFKKDLERIDTDDRDPFGRDTFTFEYAPIESRDFDSEVFKHEELEDSINEALHRGKNVKLGSPFRTPGGPKKFAVYVKTGKGTVKKVTFGDPNLRVKNNNKKAAKSFRARHNCDQKTDRTMAGYWSCNVGRYAKKLGLKSSRNW